jgi:IgGFc binding protein
MQQIQQAHIESNMPILVTQHSLRNSTGNLAISFENYQPGDDLIYLGLVDFGNLMTLVPAVSQFVTESSSATPPTLVNSVFDYNYLNVMTTVDGVLGLRLNGLPIDQGLFTTIPNTNLASASIKVGPETQKVTTASGVAFSSISYGFTRQDGHLP